MHKLRLLAMRLAAIWRKKSLEEDMDAELRFHIEMRTQENMRRGLTLEEAHRAAVKSFGNLEVIKERCREVRGGGFVETILQDLRFGFRMLWKHRVLTAIALVTLALGIGANSAIFSVVNSVLLKPLPFPQADRVIMVWVDNRRANVPEDYHSYPNLEDYRNQNHVFENIAGFVENGINISSDGEPERILAGVVTMEFFSVTGVYPAQGRIFAPEEMMKDHNRVVIISDRLWQRRFGGDANIVGRNIILNGNNYQVIGIMPRDFYFPSAETDIWIPLVIPDIYKTSRNAFWLRAIGRLKADVSFEQARAEMQVITDRLVKQYPNINDGYGINLVPLPQQLLGKVRPLLLLLLGAVFLVLLIACANVANLLLARAAERQREIAIRIALGAGRLRLIRQLLTESLLLSLTGGLLAILLAKGELKLLVLIGPRELPRLNEIQLDGRVLLFTLTISILTGLIFGLLPALKGTQIHPSIALKEGSKGSTFGPSGRRWLNMLVIAELALSLVLLAGAGLMIKSIIRLHQVALGFNPDNVLSLRLQLANQRYRDDGNLVGFYQNVLEKIKALPEVESAGLTSSVFLNQVTSSSSISIEGRAPDLLANRVEVTIDTISSDYFETLQVPLLRGRKFNDLDNAKSPLVVIINQTMAKHFWPNEDAVGKRFVYGAPADNNPWITVVGVIADSRRNGFDADVRCETFRPIPQDPYPVMTLVLRVTGDPLKFTKAVQQAIWSTDKDIPIYEVKTMNDVVAELKLLRRFIMLLLTIFAGIALILASVGTYGIMAYFVTQSRQEIGIRMALGAQPSDILKMVMSRGILLTVVGTTAGLLMAILLTRLMTSILYGVTPADPMIFSAITIMLLAIGMLACLIPARKAARLDPLMAIRYE